MVAVVCRNAGFLLGKAFYETHNIYNLTIWHASGFYLGSQWKVGTSRLEFSQKPIAVHIVENKENGF